ncbi:MAG: tryptophan synthase subunit alpha [Dehalococcoidales bacterium]|nr:tryptophan synthase subunit alpha [Dehalococcoidales bacterium]
MSRIDAVFMQTGHKALIPYVTLGYPSIDATVKTVQQLAENGADIIELGIPFSDPLADGATIQRSSYQALQNGVTPQVCIEVAAKLRKKTAVPLMFMTYFNPVLSYGAMKFCQDAAAAGIDGLIIPDLPPEEGLELENATRQSGISLVYLLAPTSTDARIRLVSRRSRGFIYTVSVIGVTGARKQLPANLGIFLKRVKRITRLPVCVGFGISTAAQAKQVARMADGVIIGSRIIQFMEAGDAPALVNFIREVRSVLDNTRV